MLVDGPCWLACGQGDGVLVGVRGFDAIVDRVGDFNVLFSLDGWVLCPVAFPISPLVWLTPLALLFATIESLSFLVGGCPWIHGAEPPLLG